MLRPTLLPTAALAFVLVACNDSPTGPGAACRGEDGVVLQTAPASARVDLGTPRFQNPTNITNPLFPISSLSRALLLGSADGLPLRVETTLLPQTRKIEFRNRELQVNVSQYVAWLGRRIHEVALDLYAQADDGSVWYFGEDVFNYENGVVVDTDGTWHAEQDGPAAMIMPNSPRVGDVWRPENICELVFEEVTMKTAGVTVTGPQGPVSGAIVVEELHMDGSKEDKTFAPGYGEFFTSGGGDTEALALAIDTDALSGAVPNDVRALTTAALEAFDAAQAADWTAASAALGRLTTAWSSVRSRSVPPLLVAEFNRTIPLLTAGIAARRSADARNAAFDVALSSYDLELRYRPRIEIDLALIDLWVRLLRADALAGDRAALLGDIATLRWIRERIANDLIEEEAARIDALLRTLQSTGSASDFSGAIRAATQLQQALGGRQ